MSYQTVYGGMIKIPEGKDVTVWRKSIPKWIAVFSCIAIVIWLLMLFNFDFSMLIPGNREITQEAVACFVSDIDNGATFEDAFRIFCRSILIYE